MRALTALSLALTLTTSHVMAEEGQPDVPPPPPLPAPGQDGGVYQQLEEGLEPQITIRKRGSEVIEEQRINGRLFRVKITPSKGRPYYLEDTDGDGSLETRRNSLDDPEVVKWRIFTW